MKRIVVHLGAQRTGTEAIHKGLFINQDALASAGVLVPQSGRHEMSPAAIRHHQLAWFFDPGGQHPHNPAVWDELASEIEASSADTVLLSSALLGLVAADPATAPALHEQLKKLSSDVTLAYLAREQLGLLNTLYCQQVKTFEITWDFDTFLHRSPDVAHADLVSSFRPWYDGSDFRFVAKPWDVDADEDALAALLELTDIDLGDARLTRSEIENADDLDPVGIEALRLLGTYLRGRFDDFDPGEPAARRLRRKTTQRGHANDWYDNDFWGWTPAAAAAAAERYAASNQEFAKHVWGGEWTLPLPRARQRHVADLVELDPASVNRVHRFLNDMEKTFTILRSREVAS